MATAENETPEEGKILGAVGFTSVEWCSICERTAVKHCAECIVDLCTTCANGHKKIAATKLHELTDIELSSHQSLVNDPKPCISHCSLHPQLGLTLCCDQCVSLICDTCKPSHEGHSIVPADLNAFQNICRKYIQRFIDGVNDLEEYKTTIKGLINSCENSIASVTQLEQELIDDIKQLAAELKEELCNSEQNWLSLLEDINGSEMLDKADEKVINLTAMRKVTKSDIFTLELQHARDLLTEMEDFTNKLPQLQSDLPDKMGIIKRSSEMETAKIKIKDVFTVDTTNIQCPRKKQDLLQSDQAASASVSETTTDIMSETTTDIVSETTTDVQNNSADAIKTSTETSETTLKHNESPQKTATGTAQLCNDNTDMNPGSEELPYAQLEEEDQLWFDIDYHKISQSNGNENVIVYGGSNVCIIDDWGNILEEFENTETITNMVTFFANKHVAADDDNEIAILNAHFDAQRYRTLSSFNNFGNDECDLDGENTIVDLAYYSHKKYLVLTINEYNSSNTIHVISGKAIEDQIKVSNKKAAFEYLHMAPYSNTNYVMLCTRNHATLCKLNLDDGKYTKRSVGNYVHEDVTAFYVDKDCNVLVGDSDGNIHVFTEDFNYRRILKVSECKAVNGITTRQGRLFVLLNDSEMLVYQY